jgi:hypothetical protein
LIWTSWQRCWLVCPSYHGSTFVAITPSSTAITTAASATSNAPTVLAATPHSASSRTPHSALASYHIVVVTVVVITATTVAVVVIHIIVVGEGSQVGSFAAGVSGVSWHSFSWACSDSCWY